MTLMPLKINSKSPFWINFFIRFKENKKLLIVISVLQLISAPLLIIMGALEKDYYSKHGYIDDLFLKSEFYAIIAVFGIALSTLLAVTIVLNNFEYLYKKSKVDMVYSMPISIKDRFLSNFFSGLAVYTVPYIGAMLLTLILHGFFCLSLESWNDMEAYTGVFIKAIIIYLLVMIFFYVLCVLIMTCCGTLFESVSYMFIINGVIPGSIAIFFYVIVKDLYGIDIDRILSSVIQYTSPVGGLVFAATELDDYFNGASVSFLSWFIIYSLVIIAVFFLSYFLYKKRKAEDVSKPFVYSLIYHISITLLMLDILSFVSDDVSALFPLVIFSAIVFMLFEIVRKRGFKKFGFTAIRYVITALCVMVLTVSIKNTNCFGIEKYVPSASMVKSVTLSYPGYTVENTFIGSIKTDFTTDSPQVISAVINAHHSSVKDIDHKSDYNSNIIYNPIEITYNMKSGRAVSRNYYMDYEEYEMLNIINMNKDYADAIAKDIKHTIVNNKNSLFLFSKLRYHAKSMDNVSSEIAGEIAQAYKNDIMAQSMEELLTPEDIYCFVYDYPVRSSYENTIAVLKKYDYTPYTLEEDVKSYTSLETINMSIYKADLYQSFNSDKYTASFGAYTSEKYVSIDSINKYFMKLLKVAQPIYVTTDDCYVISVNEIRYVIPAKYSNLAEEAYNYAQSHPLLLDGVVSDNEAAVEKFSGYDPQYFDSYYWKNYSYYDDDIYSKEQEEWNNYWKSNDIYSSQEVYNYRYAK